MEFYPPIDWTKHVLHAAANSGNRSEVERLIAKGAYVNEQLNLDVNGRGDVAGTPLHVAIRNCANDLSLYRGHHEVVQVLLAGGANIRLRRKWEGTPLHDAARRGLIHVAELLISHGADVNSKEDYEGRTPLHLAAGNNQLRMVDYLLSRGADIDTVSVDPFEGAGLDIRIGLDIGKTPLHLAAREGHAAVVRKLIDSGASLHLRRALDLALGSKRQSDATFDEIISLLSSRASE
jgi:ankyrin repeat protein